MQFAHVSDYLNMHGPQIRPHISCAIHHVLLTIPVKMNDRLVRMTSDNKLYGYDSMPLTTIPNTEINVFQIGGVLQVYLCHTWPQC
jgi:hypothetical protein